MTAHSALHPARTQVGKAGAAGVAFIAALTLTAAPAQASAVAAPAPATAPISQVSSIPQVRPAAVSAWQRASAVRIAASRRGAPYVYGAAGPWAFDCSGLTMWTWARLGKRLPRTAHDQFLATMPISSRRARVGDLVFSGGAYKYHVGVYAGNWMMWHAPRSGETVRLQRIYAKQVSFGRVR